MKETKKVFEEEIACPYCKKGILIKKIRETLEKAVSGVYKETVTVEKSKQTKLKKSWLKKK